MRVTKATQEAIADACWAVALRLPKFGYAEIAAEQKISLEQATRIVTNWQKVGLTELVQSGPRVRKLWAMKAGASYQAKPKGRSAEDNLWTAMRGLKSFSPTDLAAHATTETVSVAVDEAQAYCRALLAAGHLSVARKAVPGRKEAIYRLARNTGPRAPREKRVRAVIDDNTDAVVVISGVAP